jgi:hypothetical protein
MGAVMGALRSASTFGEATSDNGARMYGHVPHVAPMAWFHILFPPLDPAALTELEAVLGRSVPDTYRDLLARTNGLYLYSGALSLYGLRRDYSRNPAIREPFDLGDPNVRERPPAARPGWFIFAFYKADGSNAYWDPDDGRVYRGSRDMTHPRLNRWEGLDDFLQAEVRRLAGHFDGSGHRLDPIPSHHARLNLSTRAG